jgi:Diadenosine tetraphosphate (Ap4A) hydrolase and other HIT family hydrolases
MKSLFAPWRMEYLKGEKQKGCVFCESSVRDDDLVLYEREYSFVIMNRYPYTTGHLLIVPFTHVSDLEGLTPNEKREILDMLSISVRVLKEAMNPEGFNIGANLGKAAGAGVDDHLHVHVVPRWKGDTNFMTVLGETRVIPEDVRKTRDVLKPFFERLK